MERHILCIDLKSFFASCECIERNLDPFSVPLVVANKNQGKGAITLAVTPYLKRQGIKGRTRLYEIPNHISYQIVPPRMNLYLKKSSEVIGIYLDFVASEDLHVYSIDECFLDVTAYLKMYHMTDEALAEVILKTVEEKTGLTANCGIGPNLLLAKVAMDLEAKCYKNGIAKWTMDDVPQKLWPLTPLSKMWGIGPRMERNLERLGIHTIGELAHFNVHLLKDKFGIIGVELWNHANGRDEALIQEFRTPPKEKSFSHSQVLFQDYYGENGKMILREMVEVICMKLRKYHMEGFVIGLGINYSKTVMGGFYHTMKLDSPTDQEHVIFKSCEILFDRYYEEMPIRKISISIGKLHRKTGVQLSIFENFEEKQKLEMISEACDEIKLKFGKNSLLKASNLLPNSTARERNLKIGGHRA
ncbi:MAG: Y-family DNA polymerase [Bacilli bacterium]|jgi:DNA polymerase V|nr:Y-family DNA polymerase [Bacilli bacterium]